MKVPLEKLFSKMPSYRRLLQKAWSEVTIHPDYAYKPGDPTGQCGPTALWVTQHLRAHGFDAMLCTGSVAVRTPATLVNAIPSHCWTEVLGYVIDLTGSQGEGISFETICCRSTDLQRMGITYTPAHRDTPKSLKNSNLWNRYSVLLRNLESAR